MQFSEQWLRSWINPDTNTQQLADRITLAGLEVDAIDPAGAEFTGVVIGEVKSVAPHPNADKLRITEVFNGQETLQVVCGAPNVAVGMRVPFAQVGAQLPGGLVIKKAKLRGETSLGMLCGASELGFEASQDGLWSLPEDAPVGTDLREWLELDDAIITLGITPNRGDALSIAGLAQECAAVFDQPFTPAQIQPPQEQTTATAAAHISATDACPVYLTRCINNLPARGNTPIYIQERLRRSGIKSIEPVVDILNYVMLELGQPMHAFDADKLNGAIEVRFARPGEQLTALGEQTLTLSEDCLLVTDEQSPIALAGIIGSLPSSVDSETHNIVLESAHFTPQSIIGRARRYALSTDAAFRFERGVDPALPEQAMQRASKLISRYIGGEVGPISRATNSQAPTQPHPIKLDMDWASNRLGMDIPVEQAVNLLTRLGCAVEGQDTVLTVTPPTRRFDLSIKEDLLEELARLIGFDQFRAPLTRMTPEVGVLPVVVNPQASMADFLTTRGYFEAITYSFIHPEAHEHIHPQTDPIRLANPIASQMSVMRQSLWPGLFSAVAFNQKRQIQRVRLYEVGRRFSGDEHQPQEHTELAGVITGGYKPEQWAEQSRDVDFYDLKGDLLDLAAHLGQEGEWDFKTTIHPALHPGQTAGIYREGQQIGWAGMLHPQTVEYFELKGPVFAFSLDVDLIKPRALPRHQASSRFPQIRRDLALMVPRNMDYAELIAHIQQHGGRHLIDVALFDRYIGEGVGEDQQSLAVKLIFQHQERTLTDDEVNQAIDALLDGLKAAAIHLRG